MKPLKAEIPQETTERIKWLQEQTGLSQETIITTALIVGTMKLKKWTEEDI